MPPSSRPLSRYMPFLPICSLSAALSPRCCIILLRNQFVACAPVICDFPFWRCAAPFLFLQNVQNVQIVQIVEFVDFVDLPLFSLKNRQERDKITTKNSAAFGVSLKTFL